MSKKVEVSDSGVSALGLLGVAFVVLKLTAVIDWSWWWVTLPFWGGLAIVGGILAAVGLVMLLAWALAR
jgi:hypothetical protein